MISFRNVRISSKIFVAPVLTILFLVVMAVMSFFSLEKQTAALDIIYNVGFEKNALARQTIEHISSAHVDLYRMLNWMAMSNDQERIEKLIGGVDASVADGRELVAQLDSSFDLSEEEKAAVGSTAAGIEAYAKSLGEVIDMVQIDMTTGLLLMTDVEEKFANLKQTLNELNELEDALSQGIFNGAVADATRTRTIFVVLVAAALFLSAVITAVISRQIAGPISRMTSLMGRLADGHMDEEIPETDRRDEVGRMAAAVQVFKDNAKEKERLESEQEDKERQAEQERRRVMLNLADTFESSVGQVVSRVASAATEMRSSSASMSATTEEATRQSAAVAAASEQASANVQTVAAAAEELSSSITEIARQVGQASTIASGAVRQAEDTNVKVQGLAAAANKIGEVVALITDIAEQTNLLALNATIEAARAGDAGKGFAVVASEVKNLANQTAKATDEIGAQIAGIQTATQEAVSAIESISKTISEIDEVNAGIASAVEEQGAATQEIARNVEQAAAGTQEVSSNIGGVSQAANDTGAAASQIQSAAGELSQQSETLRAEVEKFLSTVRVS